MEEDWLLRFVWLVMFSVYSVWPWIIEQLVRHELFLFGMICMFGLPAGIILGFLDRRRGTRSGWIAVVKVPAIIPLGYFLLVAIPAFPVTVNVLARHGSEWLTGDVENLPARAAMGSLARACFGALLLALLLISRKVVRWGSNKPAVESARGTDLDEVAHGDRSA